VNVGHPEVIHFTCDSERVLVFLQAGFLRRVAPFPRLLQLPIPLVMDLLQAHILRQVKFHDSFESRLGTPKGATIATKLGPQSPGRVERPSRLENADSQSAQRMKVKQVVPDLLDTKQAAAHLDQDPWQRYLEAARYRHAAAKSRDGASCAINAHCDALQNAKFVPVMTSLRMLLSSASADDQTREPRTIRGSAAMSISTAPRDLVAIKHALELGLILATLIIATIMIVAAAHDDARKLTPDITIGQVMLTPA